MQNRDAISREVKNLLTLCIKTAIATALERKHGADWFLLLKSSEEHLEPQFQVLYRKESIEGCDFQALLKILSFREDARNEVMDYYGIDYKGVGGEGSDFDYLLKRIMLSYRNNMDSHLSYNQIMMMSKRQDCAVYGYNEAINDMLKLAEMFKAVEDENGVSYYEHMLARIKEFRRKSEIKYYSIYDVIKKEHMRYSAVDFINACARLGISTKTINLNIHFGTLDYERDIKRITNEIVINNSNRVKRNLNIVSVLAMFLIIVTGLSFAYPDIEKRADTAYNICITDGIQASLEKNDFSAFEDSVDELLTRYGRAPFKKEFFIDYNKEYRDKFDESLDKFNKDNRQIKCIGYDVNGNRARVLCMDYSTDKGKAYVNALLFWVYVNEDKQIKIDPYQTDYQVECYSFGYTLKGKEYIPDKKPYDSKRQEVFDVVGDNLKIGKYTIGEKAQ